jgi:hypothetical protein
MSNLITLNPSCFLIVVPIVWATRLCGMGDDRETVPTSWA